ncbi:MAG TPA: tetratricopeptide repeat protein [Rhizomicrobium sp.]|jgi:DNA-binding winged helix-turn-helix (wHTH) protein/tetratricopeptide (TPR) repeat protein
MDVSVRPKGMFAFGRFRLDPVRRNLTRDGAAVALSPKLFDTLLYLVEHPDRVVEKDELLNAVWAGRFVEESNISQTIFTLRKALSDAGEQDALISTAPGRGYRFIASVEWAAENPAPVVAVAIPSADTSPVGKITNGPVPESLPVPVRAGENAGPWSGWRAALYFVPVLLVAALAALILYRRSPPPPAKPGVIVLADFQNFTNDPAFDTVLGKVLEIDLAQSPFLSLISPQQVGETLQQMERPRNEKLTPERAQEVCARNQGNAVLSGAISALGSRYVVTLEAIDCSSGKSIAQAKAETSRKEDVPNALDRLTAQMRESLDESSASVRNFGVPIAQATTSSFDALKAFSLGERSRLQSDFAAAIPQFKRAIELDPSFSLAHEELGTAYVGLREAELAKASYQNAFDLRNRASEIEELRISANYYQLLGNFMEAAHTYQVWAQTYPQDWEPWANLATLYARMSRYADAISAGKEALRLNPEHGRPYIVLARAYKRATRFDDAKAIARRAVAKGLDGFDIHGLLYEIAFAEGDVRAMAEQVSKEKGKPTESWMLDYEAWAAAASGRLNRSRALFENAIESARAQGPDEREEVSGFFTEYIEMVSDFGLKQEADALARRATGLDESDDAPFALAKAGDFERAAALAAALGKRYPDDMEVHDIYLPLTQAATDLGQGKPDNAIGALQASLSFEMRDFDMASVLGEAYLDAKAPDRAADAFRKILDNRGVDGVSPLYPLAYLGLARALYMQGKLRESRAEYEKLFAFWKDADPDLAILQIARRECAQLSASQQTAQ